MRFEVNNDLCSVSNSQFGVFVIINEVIYSLILSLMGRDSNFIIFPKQKIFV